jgi:hypothetical protein
MKYNIVFLRYQMYGIKYFEYIYDPRYVYVK